MRGRVFPFFLVVTEHMSMIMTRVREYVRVSCACGHVYECESVCEFESGKEGGVIVESPCEAQGPGVRASWPIGER